MSSAAPGPQAGKSDYNIGDETENTRISFMGLEARGNLLDKLNYVYHHIKKKEFELEIEGAEAKDAMTRFCDELDRMQAGPSEGNEQCLTEYRACFELKKAWSDKFGSVLDQEIELLKQQSNLEGAYKNGTEDSLRHLEEVLLPDTVRYLLEIGC